MTVLGKEVEVNGRIVKAVKEDYCGECKGCVLDEASPDCDTVSSTIGSCFHHAVIWKEKSSVVTEDTAKYPWYIKDISHLDKLDIYRVLELYEVTDPALQHAAKKILVAGRRGAKDIEKDIQEVIDTCIRWQEMQQENNQGGVNVKTQ